MRSLSPADAKLKAWAASLGLIQGLAWVAMSAACLILHFIRDIEFVVDSYMEELTFLMYSMFLTDPAILPYSNTITSDVFAGITFVYLLLDVIWVIASIHVVFDNTRLNCSMKFWGTITLLICVLDFVLVVIIGSDYGKCMKSSSIYFGDLEEQIAFKTFCANALLPTLVIAAKGFTLWIVNVIFAFLLITMSPQKRTPIHNTISYGNPQVTSAPQVPRAGWAPQVSQAPQVPQTPQSPNPGPSMFYTPSAVENPYQQIPSYGVPNGQNRDVAQKPPRKWKVYTPSTGSPGPRTSDNNFPNFLNRPNNRLNGQILSHHTEKPFVLHSPPSRF